MTDRSRGDTDNTPEPGVVGVFPSGAERPDFQVGFDEQGVWWGWPGVLTGRADSAQSEAVAAAFANAALGHQAWFSPDARVVRLVPPRSG